MKRVAIVGSDFTPSSYPPALRIRFFVEHLAEFGWEPIVLTINSKEYEWEVDSENERLLPTGLRVVRTGALPIKLTRRLGLGDIGLRSMWQHWLALSKLCKSGEVDAVFIPVPPYYPAILGRLIYSSFRIPYVIDYIDPWVYDDYWKRPSAQRNLKRTISHVLSSFLEPLALKHVSHLVAVSKGTTDGVVARYPWLTEADATEIPYGAPSADFEYLRKNPRANRIFQRDDGLFHVSYVGRGGIDMRPALSAVFEAIKCGLVQKPELFSRLRVHFVGTTYAANGHDQYQIMPMVREFGLDTVVDEHPARVSYLDALQILLDSDALIVTGSDRPHYTASKIFPYIMARKPLLAVLHEESSVVQIIRETNAGHAITFNASVPPDAKSQEILSGLEATLSYPADYKPETNWELFEAYSTRSMTARLAKAFDKAVASSEVYRDGSKGVRWQAEATRDSNNVPLR